MSFDRWRSLVDGAEIDVGSAIPDSGLVQRNPFDEGSGSTVADAAGSNDGTVVGASWDDTDGRGGWNLDFDGTDNHVSWDNIDTGDGDFTIIFWCYPRDLDWVFTKFNPGGDERNWLFREVDSEFRFDFYSDPSAAGASTSITVPRNNNEWQMFAAGVDFDGDIVRLFRFRDGDVDSASDTDTGTPTNTNTETTLGVRSDDKTNASDMRADHPFVYHRAPEQDWIQDVYDGTKGDYS